jgi:hypothetical protein
VDGSKTISRHKIEGIWTFESIYLSKIMNRVSLGSRLSKWWCSGSVPLAFAAQFIFIGVLALPSIFVPPLIPSSLLRYSPFLNTKKSDSDISLLEVR